MAVRTAPPGPAGPVGRPSSSLPWSSLAVLAAVVALSACSSNMQGPPYPVVTPSADKGGPAAGAPTPPPDDPMADVRSRGTLHGQPIRISASGGRPERWVVFLGTADAARAAWVVTPGASVRAAVPVEGWPTGAKVVANVVRGQLVHLIVETQPALDQPAGIRSVVVVDANYANAQSIDESWRFIGSKDEAEIVKRLNAPPPLRVLRQSEMVAAIKDASKSAAALAKAFRTDGAEYLTVWQSVVAQPVEHLDAKTVARSTRLKKMLEIARAAAVQERCEASICWALGPKGETLGGIALGQDGGSTVIDAFLEHATVAPAKAPPAGTMPQSVPTTAGTDGVLAVLREQRAAAPRRILGEAALGQGKDGVIGVAESADEDHHLIIAVREGNFTRLYDERTTLKNGLVPREVRFADVDADGKADVIIRASGKWDNDGSTVIFHRALLSPSSVQPTALRPDPSAEFAMLGAASIDDAVKAAVAVVPKPLLLREACGVIGRAWTVDAFRAVASADARVLTFDEAFSPTMHGTAKNLQSLRAVDVRQVGRKCREIQCDPARPYCQFTNAPYAEYYYFSWNGGLRVSGAAFYNGP